MTFTRTRDIRRTIVDAGQEFALAPFGVEAQRLLRLEKKHLLPGVDTDALSNPLESDLPWIVKLDKPDFVGRRSLARVAEHGLRNRLVGFRIDASINGGQIPAPPVLVIHNGKLGGRVTSCGMKSRQRWRATSGSSRF